MNIQEYIEKNNLKEPKTFEDILKLQAILDDNIHNVRERTLTEIKLSLIAELIEFNEETKDSHKTWKTKPYSKEKELEELTDVYFFFAQLVNFIKIDTSNFNKIFENFEKQHRKISCLGIIFNLLLGSYHWTLKALIIITIQYGYTKEDILKCYWSKWQKNMERIGKEWN